MRLSLAFLIDSKVQLQSCLMFMKPKGHCTSIVSIVLLILNIENLANKSFL